MPYYFNLPIITQLTNNQQMALDETNAIALGGGPGTGKSVVCLWRHIRNYVTGTKRSLLLTYTKTLEHYLKQSANSQNADSAININRTYWWTSHPTLHRQYDEIIIDEGQDVTIDKYQIIKNHSESISYGADEFQSLYLNKEQLTNLFNWFRENFNNEEYTLIKNFRNSKEILEFTRSVFPNILIPQNAINEAITTNLKPIVKITGWDDDKEIESIMSIINDFAGDTHNIGILVPSQKMVNSYYERIKDELNENLECTKYQGDMEEFTGLSGIHITTYKSAKGTEFDTVIMPKFDSFDWFIANTENTTENDYYVAFTRTKTNLFLICKNNANKGNTNTFDIER
jgi:superfamily I DNA/RNA helicase